MRPWNPIHYFQQRYGETLRQRRTKSADVEAELAAYEERLRAELSFEMAARDLGIRQREQPLRGRMLPVVAASSVVETTAPPAAS